MQHLLTLNPENASEEEVQEYSIRDAVRAIIFDENNDIALLHVKNKRYYKLPGGGIENGESKLEALERECKEEAGCQISVYEEIGSVTEYRKIYKLKQTSYCYLATVKGDKGAPDFTPEEIEKGFELTWLSYGDALKALEESETTEIEGARYIVPRDQTFLRAVLPYIQDSIPK